MEGKFSNWRAWRAKCLIGGRPPGWRALVSYEQDTLRPFTFEYLSIEYIAWFEVFHRLVTVFLITIAP